MALLSRGIDTSLLSSPSGGYPTHTTLSYSLGESLDTQPLVFLHGVIVDMSKTFHGDAIYPAKWYETRVAAKRVSKIFAGNVGSLPDLLRGLSMELKILGKLKHPNILLFLGLSNTHGFELTPDTFIIQELTCCTLEARNRQQPQLNLRNVIDISIGVSSGLCYLHERAQPLVHHNLASRNIFLDFNGRPKIGNLAVTRTLCLGQHPQNIQLQNEVYMPPEIKLPGLKNQSPKLDIYSFGVVMLEMCIGRDGRVEVYGSTTSQMSPSLVPEVERRKVDFKDLGDKHSLRPLILSCLSPESGSRPPARHICEQLVSIAQSDVYFNTPQLPVISLGIGSMEQGGVTKEFALSAAKLKELTARNQTLEEENSNLKSDNEHFKRKLDAYIQYEREEMENSARGLRKIDDQEIEKLMSENLKLQEALTLKDAELEEMASFSSPPSSLTDTQMRDQRASLLQKINELQTSKKQVIERSLLENQALKNENAKLKSDLQVLKSSKSPKPLEQREYYARGASRYHTPSEGGPMSLPEQLPSYSSTTSSSGASNIGQGVLVKSSSKELMSIPTSKSTSSSSGPSSIQSTAPDSAAVPSMAEFKRLKKHLEKYKTKNIELDEKLKDARFELQKYGAQQGNTDIRYRMDVDRLRAENNRLQAQLDNALAENSRLRSMRPY